VLAIGLDAAEGSLIRRLADAGELPEIAALIRAGLWSTLRASELAGSGGIWPTFVSGRPAPEHGVYGEWVWDPRQMAMRRPRLERLVPLHKTHDAPVGMFGVPAAWPSGREDGFDVTGWGVHDRWAIDTTIPWPHVTPPHLRPLLGGPHPIDDAGKLPPRSPEDWDTLADLGRACLEGTRLRGEVAARFLEAARPAIAIVVFAELHHCVHQLWHTAEPDHPAFAGLAEMPDEAGPTLLDILREADAQVGRLAAAVDGPPPVLFSLHGTEAARGIVNLTDALLVHHGFAEHHVNKASARGFAAAVKRRTPRRVKLAWYRRAPRRLTDGVAELNLQPRYRWDRTRAIALATDQHGRIQVNLRGREAHGIVEPRDYPALLDELEALLAGLTDERGRPLVGGVYRGGEEGPPERVPDITFAWTEAASVENLVVRGLPGIHTPRNREITALHTFEGFCVVPPEVDPPDVAAGTEQVLGWLLRQGGAC
jgi:predicted AlkP superfamily phosphohydrolase/phosphomutase